MKDLGPEFFERDPVTCAQDLIGCRFRWNGCMGRIVETEAYQSVGDEACHTWFRPSARKFVASHPAGTAYVYLNYGVHWLFNVLVKGPVHEGFVLFRALEPLAGLEEMEKRTGPRAEKSICAGPGRLTKSLGIGGEDHGTIFLQRAGTGITKLGETAWKADYRVGISRDAHFPWRFVDPLSPSLSRKISVQAQANA